MRVFLTGSTGFIGSQVARELLNAGHQVLGLTRSDAGARELLAMGAEPHHGNIEDLASLQRGAEVCDAVIHTAFDHDFTHFVANCQKDSRAIAALGSALEGSERPLIITSGTPMGSPSPGQPADEDHFDPEHPHPRIASELAGEALLQRGGNVVVMRLSQIHNPHKQGLVTEVIKQAREMRVSAYIDEGLNQWSAAHVADTAHLYRLALEKHQPGARYHATAESSITFRLIAETIGEGLGVPTVAVPADEAIATFGWLSSFVGKDMSSMSTKTQTRLGWQPSGPGLIDDLRSYFIR
ncbi:SDR family oxidoreductase [Pseudomonas frederiksbergensis]|uniref:Aurachin B dehydrogenase n=1 Tax=Pseudomonas frederiksbergensis TaxID=104087 RepID=A0A6L5C488_9PSED|nr:SDR family oxidoreductase [Pseudomonas frederiksbergensis]KAF2394287.1 Aurachin B dehydrogenase [Pseudomonas frederiksbergensis]